MHREISALIDAQESWAKPVGERVQGWLGQLFADRRPLKDALNGTWLGHPLHPAITDVPVGAMSVAALFDLTGQRRAADVAVATGLASMVGAAVTGAADAVDAYGRPRRPARQGDARRRLRAVSVAPVALPAVGWPRATGPRGLRPAQLRGAANRDWLP
jgi:hypothetical protein